MAGADPMGHVLLVISQPDSSRGLLLKPGTLILPDTSGSGAALL